MVFNVPRFIVISKNSLKRIKSDDELYNRIVNNFISRYGNKLPKKVSIRLSLSKDGISKMNPIIDLDFEKVKLVKSFLNVKDFLDSIKDKEFTYSIIIQEMVYGNF